MDPAQRQGKGAFEYVLDEASVNPLLVRYPRPESRAFQSHLPPMTTYMRDVEPLVERRVDVLVSSRGVYVKVDSFLAQNCGLVEEDFGENFGGQPGD